MDAATRKGSGSPKRGPCVADKKAEGEARDCSPRNAGAIGLGKLGPQAVDAGGNAGSAEPDGPRRAEGEYQGRLRVINVHRRIAGFGDTPKRKGEARRGLGVEACKLDATSAAPRREHG